MEELEERIRRVEGEISRSLKKKIVRRDSASISFEIRKKLNSSMEDLEQLKRARARLSAAAAAWVSLYPYLNLEAATADLIEELNNHPNLSENERKLLERIIYLEGEVIGEIQMLNRTTTLCSPRSLDTFSQYLEESWDELRCIRARQASKRARSSSDDVTDSSNQKHSSQFPKPFDPLPYRKRLAGLEEKGQRDCKGLTVSSPSENLLEEKAVTKISPNWPGDLGPLGFRVLGPDEYEEEQTLYYQEVDQHKGYVITSPFGDRLGDGIRPADLKEYDLKELAEFAVSEYNGLLPPEDGHKRLRLENLEAVNYQVILRGILHYVTLMASGSSGKEKFYSRVFKCYNGCNYMFDFRPASDQSGPPALGTCITKSLPWKKDPMYSDEEDEDEDEDEQVKCKRIQSAKPCIHMETLDFPPLQLDAFPYVKPFNPPL